MANMKKFGDSESYSEKQLQLLFEYAPDACYLNDLKGTFIDGNKAAEDLLGYKRSEIIGKNFLKLKLLSSKDMPRAARLLARNALGKGTGPDEFTITRKDGTNVTTEISTYPVKFKKRTLVIGIARDITERKMAEDKLRQKEYIIESASSAIATSDLDGKMTYANPVFLEMWGFGNPQEFLGKHFAEFWLVEDEIEDILKALRNDGRWSKETKARRKNGSIFDVQVSAALVSDREVNPISLMSSSVDITERKRAEMELKESEVRLKKAQQVAKIGSWEQDLATNSLIWSDEVYRMVGLEPRQSESSQSEFLEYVHPDDREYLQQAFRDSIKNKTPYDIVHRLLLKDGTVKYVNERCETIYDDSGKALRSVGTVQDITDRKLAEDELNREREFSRTIIQSSPTFFVAIDPEGKTLLMNQAMLDAMGYSEEEIAGKDYLKTFVPERERELLAGVFNQLISSGEPKAIENHVLTRDGTELLVEWHGRQIVSYDGKTEYFFGVGMDITKRKKTEERLRASENLYRTLFESAGDAIFTLDVTEASVSVKECNSRTLELFGCQNEDIIGKSPVDFSPPMQPDGRSSVDRQKELADAAIKGESQFFEWSHCRLDGSPFEAEVTLIRVDISEKTCLQAIVRDSTDRKQAEVERRNLQNSLQQAQKMESIGTMAGGIAHDFNNILFPIIGYTELALEEMKEGTLHYEYLQEVLRAGLRARDLVKQILTFSRQSDKEVRQVKLRNIVKEVLKLLRASLPSTIEIEQELQSDSVIQADPSQIHQVLMNLCANASHAMREEGGVLEVKLEDVELDNLFAEKHPDIVPGRYLKLTVGDTGHGMSDRVLERIFDPFFTTKEKGEGTGMGLAVVHGIVTSYGGTIVAYSKPGYGSSFNVFLPVTEIEVVQDILEKGEMPGGSERILFIDDEPALVKLGRQMLESLGYRVTTKTSSVEALEYFCSKADDFDLVITDLTMPKMTGIRLAGQVLKRRPDMPVILCTGFGAKMDKKEAESSGIRAFLYKPILRRKLAETIRNVLSEANASGE